MVAEALSYGHSEAMKSAISSVASVFVSVALAACGSGEDVPSAAAQSVSAAAAETPSSTVTAEASASAEASTAATIAASAPLGDTSALGDPPPADAASAAPSASGSNAPKPADPSRLVIKGKAIQGALLFAKVDGKVGRIDFPGHRAVVSDDGEFPIAFFRNAPAKEKMTIHFKDNTFLTYQFDIEQRTYETDKIDGLPENVVKLDAETKKKSAQAELRVDAVRAKYSKKNCYAGGFIWPVTGKVTSRWGQPRILNGTDGGIHWGVDVSVPVGTPVKAPSCGTVVFAEADLPLAGGTLVIDHGHGVTSTFIHLAAFKKKVGDEVKQGDIVAQSGKSGRATGAHLHWAMNYFEIRVDPELLVPPMKAK